MSARPHCAHRCLVETLRGTSLCVLNNSLQFLAPRNVSSQKSSPTSMQTGLAPPDHPKTLHFIQSPRPASKLKQPTSQDQPLPPRPLTLCDPLKIEYPRQLQSHSSREDHPQRQRPARLLRSKASHHPNPMEPSPPKRMPTRNPPRLAPASRLTQPCLALIHPSLPDALVSHAHLVPPRVRVLQSRESRDPEPGPTLPRPGAPPIPKSPPQI